MRYPGVPVTALTATAAPEVESDILKSLKMSLNGATGQSAAVYKTSFFRGNLFIRFCAKPSKASDAEEVLVQYLNTVDQSAAAIVYCFSRKQCEGMAAYLQTEGLSAAAYHAGLTPKKRHAAQSDWQAGAHLAGCTRTIALLLLPADLAVIAMDARTSSLSCLLQLA